MKQIFLCWCISLLFLVVTFSISSHAPAFAEPVELRTPDGQTVILYDDFTWEFKRAAPSTTGDTVDLDDLVKNPSRFEGEEVVITGQLADLLGAYRLNSREGQNNIVVDVEKVRRADQIDLEKAFDEAGWTDTLKTQITGTIELGTVTYSLIAKDIVLLEP